MWCLDGDLPRTGEWAEGPLPTPNGASPPLCRTNQVRKLQVQIPLFGFGARFGSVAQSEEGEKEGEGDQLVAVAKEESTREGRRDEGV